MTRPPAWRRLARRPLGAAAAAWLIVVIVTAALAPVIAPYGPQVQNLGAALSGPSGRHWLGTDPLGRDVLSQLLYGARPTLVGVAAALATWLVVGVTLGVIAGYARGVADTVISRVADLLLCLPVLVILLVIFALFPDALVAPMAILGVIASAGLIRVVRSVTLTIRDELYIRAARVAGLSRTRIMVRHVLPRVAPTVAVQAGLFAGVALITESGLAFLGFGVVLPAPSWGGLIAEASQVLARSAWLLVPSGGVLGLTVVAFVLLGTAIRDTSTERWATTQLTARGGRAGRPVVDAGAADGAGEPGGPDAGVAAIGPLAAEADLDRLGHPVRAETAPGDAGDRAGAGHPAGAETRVPSGARGEVLLRVERLSVAFGGRDDARPVVSDLSFVIRRGETLAVLGESGCGKTITALAILGLLPGAARRAGGRVWLGDQELTALTARELAAIRGRRIGYVAQDPMVSLDPTFPVGAQVAEAVRARTGAGRAQARRRAAELLGAAGLPDPDTVGRRYPHQLSGGMLQRCVIALALAGGPELLIADEPTTALDVTIQAEILALLRGLQRDRGMALLLVTHDWGVVAAAADRALVMYAGELAETAGAAALAENPAHPYTRALLASHPALAAPGARLAVIGGAVPVPGAWPAGCRFAPRCPEAEARCRAAPVAVRATAPGHLARCLHVIPAGPVPADSGSAGLAPARSVSGGPRSVRSGDSASAGPGPAQPAAGGASPAGSP